LQQVGAQGFADAQLVDPRKLPVPLEVIARGAQLSVARAWILHRKLIVRGMLALVLCAGGIVAYEMRDKLATAGGSGVALVKHELAHMGFGISKIDISGQSLTAEADILKALAITPDDLTLTFNVDAALSRIESIPTVKSATIRRIYPSGLGVTVVEKVPMARWRIGDVTQVVDEDGSPIVADDGSFHALPLVVGQGAADDAKQMIQLLDKYPDLTAGLAALSRIGERRWDLIFYSGLRVELPESGVAQAVEQLAMYQQQNQLLDRDVTVIDMRVPGMLALTPGDLAAQAWANFKKQNTHVSKGGDSEYETAAERAGKTQ
jgi:cell division protein FtsQ